MDVRYDVRDDVRADVSADVEATAVALIIKRREAAAGFDLAQFAGHSARSGFATSTVRRGMPEFRIAEQTRHASLKVLRRYVRAGRLFETDFAFEIGLGRGEIPY